MKIIKMFRFNLILLFAITLVLTACSTTKSVVTKPNPAAESVQNDSEWWGDRHKTILSRLDTDPELVLVGNSIFHTLENEDRDEVWSKYLNRYRTVDMGISGDRTENVIWRLQNGALEGISPKVALVLIGTNNTDGNHYLNISTPDELSGGIWKICEIIQDKLPHTEIVLMGILPYGYKPNHRDNINKATNKIIATFPKKNSKIHYVDISSVYLDENEKVKKELMPDYLHPNAKGHLLMFEALEGHITKFIDK
ncbi:GDSL-type esterase/lipase family protein [Kriegella aquimaris]|uniref:Lysophospholipase L1 n=1 Tax=Kriegella aquimaris TaxID=192904 RepID=A0A1G9UIY0_9FLAO|nr:GDSL-type esterase/lipase family protein [Kriegella aquimaris]SDM59900.1 Lysophospholipase L1 [Kriegella aquimaris]